MAVAAGCAAHSVREGCRCGQLSRSRVFSVKVLVTGAAGQVGQALTKSAPAGTQIIGCTHKELDIGSATAVDESIRRLQPEVIVNCAAYTAVDKAEAESDAARAINTEGPRNLARAAQSSG